MRTELTDFQIEYRDMPPIDVKAPCSLVSALAAIGEAPTPRAAGDDERIAEILAHGATFSATLTADELLLSHRYVFLRFHGLFAPAQIGIDGRTVADACNLHAVTTVELRNYLTPGEHRLTVAFPPREKAAAHGTLFFDDVGIFRPVECITTDEAAIENVGVVAETRGEDTFLRVRVELLGEGRGTRAVARVESPSGQYFYAGLPDFCGEVNVRRATRWYPAGLGEAACYHLTVTLYRDAEAIDEARLSVGVRALTRADDGGDDPFAFAAEGIRFVPRGTAYLPTTAILARETAARVRVRTEAAAAAGVNAFFVPDVGIYPPESFYESCDRLGIAVFQELCAPSAEKDAVRAAYDLIARTAHHPSLLCYYTDKESLVEPLDACVKEYDPTLSCVFVKKLPFASFPSLPAMSTLRTYLPADGWNYFSDAMISSEEQEGDLLRILNAGSLFYPYANGMEKLVYLSGIVQADRLKTEIYEKRRKDGISPPLMFGSLSDAKTRTSSSLIDSTGKKKAAWYGFRRATAPTVLIPTIEDGFLTVTLSNLSPAPFRGNVTCLLSDAYNRVQKKLTSPVAAPPVSHTAVLRVDLTEWVRGHEKEFYLSFTLSDGQNTVFSDTALLVPPRSFRFSYPDITYEIKGSGRDFVLTVSAAAFVKYVKFDFQNIEVEWSDNYVDLVKEAPIRIPFTTRSNTAAEALIRDFSYRSVYDLFRDESTTAARERPSEPTLLEEEKYNT